MSALDARDGTTLWSVPVSCSVHLDGSPPGRPCCATRRATKGLVLLAAASGAYVGDLIAYAIGSRIDVHRLPFLRRGRGRRTLTWAERSLTNGGTGFILAARFLPVARVAVNMAAGALGYPRRRFLGIAAIGSVAWAGYSAMIGIGAGAWLQGRPLGAVMLGIVVGLLVGGLLDAVFRWRQRQFPDDDAPEVAVSVRASD